jgi:hypothetical protein
MKQTLFVATFVALTIVFIVAVVFVVNSVVPSLGGRTTTTREVQNVVESGGVLNLGESASTSFTASQICNNTLILQNPTGSGDDVGASDSFPTSASLIANCLPNTMSTRTLIFQNTATASGRDVEFNESVNYDLYLPATDLVATLSFTDEGWLRFTNINGTSVSVEFYRLVTGD